MLSSNQSSVLNLDIKSSKAGASFTSAEYSFLSSWEQNMKARQQNFVKFSIMTISGERPTCDFDGSSSIGIFSFSSLMDSTFT